MPLERLSDLTIEQALRGTCFVTFTWRLDAGPKPASRISAMSNPFWFGRRQSLTVADILKAREHPVTTIKPTETVGELARQLQRLRIGCMIVSGDGNHVDGIISERDVAYGLALYRGDLHTLPVSRLMTKQVVTCEPHEKVSDIARLMNERRIRHVPVIDADRLVGVLSIRDVTMHRIEELQRLFRLIQTRFK